MVVQDSRIRKVLLWLSAAGPTLPSFSYSLPLALRHLTNASGSCHTKVVAVPKALKMREGERQGGAL